MNRDGPTPEQSLRLFRAILIGSVLPGVRGVAWGFNDTDELVVLTTQPAHAAAALQGSAQVVEADRG